MSDPRPIRLTFLIAFLAALLAPAAWGIYTYKPAAPSQDAPAPAAPAAPVAQSGQADQSPVQSPPAKSAVADAFAALLALPHNAQSGFNSDFPLRTGLVKLNNAARIAVFGESPVKSVVLGKNGWLYYNSEWVMEDYENLAPFSDEDLDKIEKVQAQRARWLAGRGIRYYVMVAPNSQTINPENLPDRYHKLSPVSRLDQVEQRLALRPDFNLVDPRQAVLAAKAQRRAYHMTDTHWNDWGAFAAANLLLGRIHQDIPAVQPDRLEDSTLTVKHTQGGDLAGLLSLEFPEELPSIAPNAPRLAKRTGGSDPQGRLMLGGVIIMETGRPDLPRAVVFQDSFCVALMPMLAEHFSRIVYVWNFDFDAQLIEREKPDVVILECVERYIYALTLNNPKAVSGE
ncbi:MAG: hypothetical protein HQK81_01030 [Desulfovibrionaceae bacterium]|nr:hypothetical protein [Desulfovibrionaceae bacterium]MBF0512631.1 hypothetical protein [Desulfovibrionaceae bacterium]